MWTNPPCSLRVPRLFSVTVDLNKTKPSLAKASQALGYLDPAKESKLLTTMQPQMANVEDMGAPPLPMITTLPVSQLPLT
jgi:hypothetical protein